MVDGGDGSDAKPGVVIDAGVDNGMLDAALGCSPATCDGCCDGDVCRSGTSTAACGLGGAACVDCGSRGTCATEETNMCVVDPASRWNVIALRAKLPEKKKDGRSWDLAGGLPDGLARGQLSGDATGDTRSVTDTLMPVWNEPIATDIRAADIEGLVIEVLDNDPDGDDVIAACAISIPEFGYFGGPELLFQCPDRAGYELVITLEPN
ncbi:MAG TPA: C2 domain-containing protein [Kofleriaceae bacterium]|nr:C2 domain-containing protein [Kofleriaceae bacterium]